MSPIDLVIEEIKTTPAYNGFNPELTAFFLEKLNDLGIVTNASFDGETLKIYLKNPETEIQIMELGEVLIVGNSLNPSDCTLVEYDNGAILTFWWE